MELFEVLSSFGFEAEADDTLEVLDGFRQHLEDMYAEYLTPAYIANDPSLQAAAELLEFGDLHEVIRGANLLAQHVQEENELWEYLEFEEMNN